MQNQNITNRLVVVSRWHSGNHLGKRRFEIITQCTKAAIYLSATLQQTNQPMSYSVQSPTQGYHSNGLDNPTGSNLPSTMPENHPGETGQFHFPEPTQVAPNEMAMPNKMEQ